jgi:hypothetical protein
MPWALLKPFLPYLIGLALLAGAYVAGDVHGHKVDTAAWQDLWTARDLSDAQGVAAELARQKAAEDAHKALDLQVIHDKDDAIASGLAANADLSKRLSRALAAHGGGQVPGTAPPAGGTVAAGDGDACTSGLESANQRVYDAAVQCAATLTALQADCR